MFSWFSSLNIDLRTCENSMTHTVFHFAQAEAPCHSSHRTACPSTPEAATGSSPLGGDAEMVLTTWTFHMEMISLGTSWLPSGNLTQLLNITIYSELFHEKW